jgi:hypothetical protein
MQGGADDATAVFKASRRAGRAMASQLSRFAMDAERGDPQLDARVVIEAAIEFLQETIASPRPPQSASSDEPPGGSVLS